MYIMNTFHNGYSRQYNYYKNFVGGFIYLIHYEHDVQWFITKSEGLQIIF